MKTATIRARIEPELKSSVESILVSLGISTSDAITMFYKQIELHNGFPFEIKIPNSETINAMKEARINKGMDKITVDELKKALRNDFS